MRKIALYNNKGGVAKTTSVINLAYCIQKAGYKVLVVDCDSQSNCFDFFLPEQPVKDTDSILPTDYEKIGSTTWARYNEVPTAELTDYDYILFDLPPAMTDEVKQIILPWIIMLLAAPCVAVGFLKVHDLPFEQYFKYVLKRYTTPQKRVYQDTETNLFCQIYTEILEESIIQQRIDAGEYESEEVQLWDS